MVAFRVVDTLSGRIVGQLYPNRWELVDPLRAPGTGSLTVPLPAAAEVGALIDLTLPRRRWLACQADDGSYLWGGPIPRRPARTGNEVVVPLVDWRSWFYRAPIRPTAAGARRNYIRTGSKALDQGQMMVDLMRLALATPGAPRIAVDDPPVTGIKREMTALMLDRSVGEYLDSIVERDQGAEWYTYVAEDPADPLKLLPHVAVAWPERYHRVSPVRVEYRLEQGGNATDYVWPEGGDVSTRVWAVGDGEPPDQVYASDEYPELEQGVEVVWEEVLGPLDGVVKAGTAFDYAYKAVTLSRGREGSAEFTVPASRVPLSDVATGDRARIILEDGWDAADVEAARITSRTLSGGTKTPTVQRLTVDLADDQYPDRGDEPGEEGESDE